MKRFFAGLCYFLAAFGLISSFMGLAQLLGPNSVDKDPGGMVGEFVGLFIIPILFFLLGRALSKNTDS